MDPRFDNDAQTTGTLRVSARAHSSGSSPQRPEPPAWLAGDARRASAPPGATSRSSRTGREVVVAGQPGVDADRPVAGRRHPLRRRDGVAPSCPDRQRGGRRTRARRPLAQRHPGQRPARRVEPAGGRRRDRRSAATRCTSWTPCQAAQSAEPAALSRVDPRIVSAAMAPTRSRSCRSRAARARPRPSAPWPTCSGASASTCWPSTSTRRATCRTTSTFRADASPTIADVLSGDAKVKEATHDGDRPGDAEPRRGRALAERARWAARSCSRRRSRTPARPTT